MSFTVHAVMRWCAKFPDVMNIAFGALPYLGPELLQASFAGDPLRPPRKRARQSDIGVQGLGDALKRAAATRR